MNKRRDRKPDENSKGSSASGLIILIIILLLVTFGGFLRVSSRSTYCAKCHVMKPYVTSWAQSSHNTVGCVKCHYEPGNSLKANFIGLRMYAKSLIQSYNMRPFAVVSDASCSSDSCHPDAIGKDSIEFQTVNFSHKTHMEGKRRGKRLSCSSCHSQIVHWDLKKSTTETCFLCHLRPVEGETLGSSYTAKCVLCHEVPSDVISVNGIEIKHTDEKTSKIECTVCHSLVTSGDGKADEDRCFQCHADKSILTLAGEVEFVHKNHVDQNHIACSNCHHEISHKNPSLDQPIPADCVSCHPRHHEAESLMYNTYELGAGEKYASPEFTAHVECRACHNKKVGDRFDPKGVTFLASKESCNVCHLSQFGDMMKSSSQSIDLLMQEIRTELHITRPKLERTPFSSKEEDEMRAILDDVEQKMILIERGKSVHNLQYADTLIRRSHDRINGVLVKLGEKAYRSDRIEAFRTASAQPCNQCHYGIADFSTKFGAIAFSHMPHLADGKLSCTSCHEYKSKWEPHGTLKFQDAQGCKTCHGQSGGCRSCHTDFDKTKLSAFGTDFIHEPHLIQPDFKCLDCHLADSKDNAHGAIRLTQIGDCTGCHHGPEQTLGCDDCHAIQASLMNGRIPDYTATVKGLHDFTCEKCHDTSQKHSKTLIGRKCAECHDGTYAAMIDEWSTESRQKISRLGNLIKRAESIDLSDEQIAQLNSIKSRHKYLSGDKIPGIHNPVLWKKILDEDTSRLENWLK